MNLSLNVRERHRYQEPRTVREEERVQIGPSFKLGEFQRQVADLF